IRAVGEGFANLPDAEVQPLFEVDQSGAAPDGFSDLVAGHHFAAASGQQFEDFEGVRWQLNPVPLVTKLSLRAVHFEPAKPQTDRVTHQKLISISGRSYGWSRAPATITVLVSVNQISVRRLSWDCN